MNDIIKLPSGINPVVPTAQEEIDALIDSMLAELNNSDDHGRCKHNLRTSFLEKEVVVYCTKCTYRIKGAQAWKTK